MIVGETSHIDGMHADLCDEYDSAWSIHHVSSVTLRKFKVLSARRRVNDFPMRIQWMIIATLTSLLMWGGLCQIGFVFLRDASRHDRIIAHLERRLERRFL